MSTTAQIEHLTWFVCGGDRSGLRQCQWFWCWLLWFGSWRHLGSLLFPWCVESRILGRNLCVNLQLRLVRDVIRRRILLIVLLLESIAQWVCECGFRLLRVLAAGTHLSTRCTVDRSEEPLPFDCGRWWRTLLATVAAPAPKPSNTLRRRGTEAT